MLKHTSFDSLIIYLFSTPGSQLYLHVYNHFRTKAWQVSAMILTASTTSQEHITYVALVVILLPLVRYNPIIMQLYIYYNYIGCSNDVSLTSSDPELVCLLRDVGGNPNLPCCQNKRSSVSMQCIIVNRYNCSIYNYTSYNVTTLFES